MKRLFLTLIVLYIPLFFASAQHVLIDSILITATRFDKPEKAMKVLSKNFYARYSIKAYVSKMRTVRIVRSNVGYIDFKAAIGFLSSGRGLKNKFRPPLLASLDRFSSYSYQSNQKDILEPNYLKGPYPIGYDNEPMLGVPIGDLLELSPLNPALYKYYIYTFDDKDKRIIHFKSDNSVKFNKLPVITEGYIIYNDQQVQIERIFFNDYAGYNYSSAVIPKAYNISISLDFVESDDQLILNKYSYHRIWNNENLEKSYYDFPSARRNPVKNGIEEWFILYTAPPIYLSEDMIDLKIKNKNIASIYQKSDSRLLWWILSFGCAPYTPDRWKIDFDSFDIPVPFKDIVSDLSKDTPLSEQVMKYKDYTPTIIEFNRFKEIFGFSTKDISDYDTFIEMYKVAWDAFNRLYDLE